MKIETFGEITAKTACPGKFWLIFEKFFRATRRLIWMIHLVYDYFLEFGKSDRLYIAYFDCSKWSWRVGNGVAHFLHLDHSIIMLRRYRNTCFDQFFAIFSSLVHRIDFILHISIVLSGVYYLAIMLDHSKVTKLHFWMIQSAKNKVFLT